MKYLFFDIECANVFDGDGKMCSFGYLLADENLNIIKTEDILMDPESDWDYSVLKKILAYDKSEYEKNMPFDSYYDEIAGLFDSGTIVFGHAVDNDAKYLNVACKRYNLPYINYKFYDTQALFEHFYNLADTPSLDKISEMLECEKQNSRHTSVQDANLCYQHLRRICKLHNITIDDVLKIENIDGYSESGSVKSNRLIKKEYPSSDNTMENKKNFVIFSRLLDNLELDTSFYSSSRYANKNILISSNYSKDHFRQMLYISQLVFNLDGNIVKNAKDADMYISFELKDENNNIIEAKTDKDIKKYFSDVKIESMSLDKFLDDIGYDEDDVYQYYLKVLDRFPYMQKKIVKKPEENKSQEAATFSVGSIFEEFFKDYKK